MKYVSDSAKAKKDKKKRSAPTPRKAVKTTAVKSDAPEISSVDISKRIVTERDGVRVDVSAAMRNAQRQTPTRKRTPIAAMPQIDSTKILIGVAIALAVLTVMALVYYFSSEAVNNPAEEELEASGYPALVGGLSISQEPTAVVSLSPLLTEMTKTLPLTSPLVGVSDYCDNYAELPTVGTPLLPDIDAILALNPNYLLTLTPLTQQQKTELSQQGCEVLEFDSPTGRDGITALASEVATFYLGTTKGIEIGEAVYDRFYESLAQFNINLPLERPTFALVFDMSGFSATPDTEEASIFESILGTVSVAGENYATSLDQVVASNPGVLILPDYVTPADVEASALVETEAYTTGRIFYIDMTLLETYSPNLLFTLADIADKVY